VADRLLGRPWVADHGYGEAWQACLREKGWAGAVRQVATDQLDLAVRLGFDMLYVIGNPVPAAAVPPAVPETVLPEDPVERVRLANARRRASAGPLNDDRFHVYVCLQEEMARRGLDLPILAPAWSHGIWTNTDLMQTLILEPEVAHEHFALCTRDSLAVAERYLRLGIDMIGVGGDFAGNRPLISPAAYREFIMPEVRTVSRYVHARNRLTVNASDGDLWSVIDDFLLGCEVDGYAEIDFHAGMDLRRLKQQFGGRITFIGNLDCGNVLSFATPGQVEQHVTECLEAGLGNGGHILCTSNAITESIPLANYLAIQTAYRRFFGLSPLRLA
jgi:hypothetical protein